MIRILGTIDLNLNKITKVMRTFVSSNTDGLSSEHWRNSQIKMFSDMGMSEMQIANWKEYLESITGYNQYSTTDMVFTKFLEKLLGEDFFERNGCLPKINEWRIQEQKPGHITIPHIDIYESVTLKNNTNKKDLLRLWIPLEDAKFGQALFVGDEVVYKFKAGEIYDWDNEMHTGVNAGFDSRYTLLIYIKKKESDVAMEQ